MSTVPPDLFYTYKTGPLTVIGFDGRHLERQQPERCRDALINLIGQHDCQVLAVDLMGVPIVSSWILGVLAAIRNHGVQVELYHPSADMREVLDVTHLDQFLHIRNEAKPDRMV